MKFLIIGLGSMGKRRIRNLQKLGHKNIIGFDPRIDRCNETKKMYKIPTFTIFQDSLNEKPDAFIISTPPDLHAIYAKIAIKQNIHFFMEVNMSSKNISSLIALMKNKNIIGVPSCTMRYHPIVTQLKKLLEKNSIGKILQIHHHWGHYLPNWHPWEDYRDFYVSKKETGAAKEIIPFEIVWLVYLFSDINWVWGNAKKISNLKTDIDDAYQILMQFKNKILCSMTVDVVSIPSFRDTKIIGTNGSIICNFNDGTIQISKGKSWKSLKADTSKVAKGYVGNTPPETLYENEMKAFIHAIKQKKKYPHSLRDELKILKILDSIEKSNKTGKKILITK